MLLRRAPGFVAALILLPLSILAPAIPGYTVMVCRLTGTAVATDCGGAVKDDAPAPLEAGWAAASCCDVLRVTFDRTPAEVHLEQPTLLSFMGQALPVSWSAPLPPARVRGGDDRATAPPGLGPPRRLITQSFLI